MDKKGFYTNAVHGRELRKDVHGALNYPIYDGVAFAADSAEDLAAAFGGRKPQHVYSRITNPTVEAFEQKVVLLEDGLAAVAVSSGMAAISNVLLTLLKQGDSVVAASDLFGGTYSLLMKTLRPLGIATRFVPIDDPAAVAAAIDATTKIIFFETISNPRMVVADIASLAAVARQHNLLTVVDSTMTPPCIFRPGELGVSVVVHSSTKTISGGATSVGGVIIDTGNQAWGDWETLGEYRKLKQWAFTARLRKEVYRDLGSCLSPHNAYLQSLGLETLALRVDRSCTLALALAVILEKHPAVEAVFYPGLPSSPYHELATRQFQGAYGTVLSFAVADRARAFQFLNRLQVIKRATNLGDNRTLALHPASTIFVEYNEEERNGMGVSEGMIRLSVGLEDEADLLADLIQALAGE